MFKAIAYSILFLFCLSISIPPFPYITLLSLVHPFLHFLYSFFTLIYTFLSLFIISLTPLNFPHTYLHSQCLTPHHILLSSHFSTTCFTLSIFVSLNLSIPFQPPLPGLAISILHARGISRAILQSGQELLQYYTVPIKRLD